MTDVSDVERAREREQYYLRSILRNLQELRDLAADASPWPSLGGEVLADNIDFLDCFIDARERSAVSHGKMREALEVSLLAMIEYRRMAEEACERYGVEMHESERIRIDNTSAAIEIARAALSSTKEGC